VDELLPTPTVGDSKAARDRTSGRSKGEDSQHHDGVTLSDAMRLLPTPKANADRKARSSMVGKKHWGAPALEQAVELAQGILPREFETWDEVPGRSRTSPSSLGSAASTSPSSPSASSAWDRSSGTPPAPESSSDGGRLFPAGETSKSSPLLPTPRAEKLTPQQRDDFTPNLMMRIAALTSSSVGSPASQQATLADARERPMIVGSGRSSPELFASCDREWFCSRMYLDFEVWRENGMPPLTAAYVAGLIDGEGCIGITVNNRRTKPTYQARIDVGMSEKALPLLEALRRQYGGSLSKTRESTSAWGAAWRWALTSRAETTPFLRAIKPHLMLKAEQADLALRLLAMVGTLPKTADGKPKWTDQARADAATIRAQVMDLNRKGPTVTQQAGWFARYVGGQWLTDQRSLLDPTGWEKFSGTWPAWGMTRRGSAFALPTSARATDASGSSSLLHTPTATDKDGKPRYDHRASPGYVRNKPVPNLAAQIVDELLPTPVADHSRGLAQPGTDYQSLPNAVLGLRGEPTSLPSDDGSES